LKRSLTPYAPQAYALLRMVIGLLFFMHGTQKILGWPASGRGGPSFASLTWFAGMIEMIGGALIAAGLFAGVAAFIASGTMAVAYFKSHFSLEQFWPIQNKGELAVVYCFIFLYIACHGSGIWSIDSARRRSTL
jgi:putative oxidoreductase